MTKLEKVEGTLDKKLNLLVKDSNKHSQSSTYGYVMVKVLSRGSVLY